VTLKGVSPLIKEELAGKEKDSGRPHFWENFRFFELLKRVVVGYASVV
jgi:hypothetical protein